MPKGVVTLGVSYPGKKSVTLGGKELGLTALRDN